MGNCQLRQRGGKHGNGVGCRERRRCRLLLFVVCLFLHLLHVAGAAPKQGLVLSVPRAQYRKDPFQAFAECLSDPTPDPHPMCALQLRTL